jgi:hypothetical protein
MNSRVLRLALAAGAVVAATAGLAPASAACPIPDDSKFAGLHKLVCEIPCPVPDDSKFTNLHRLACEWSA